ncbi:MAG: hypothetical protein M1327_06170 [Candidatus Thermoplasmatota archaeon]|nr:hypothetical protein [Candidatus Thermoplasmatota archaeon]
MDFSGSGLLLQIPRMAFRMIDPDIANDVEASIAEFVREKRWYGSKSRDIQRVELEYFSKFAEHFILCMCRFFYNENYSERYFIPFSLREMGNSFITVRMGGGKRRLYDATDDSEFVLAVARLIMNPEKFPSQTVQLRVERTSFSQSEDLSHPEVRKITAEQSNTSVVIGNKLILKIYRKIIGAENPDYKIPVLLWEKSGFRQTPMPVGKAELDLKDRFLVATLSQYLEGSTDGWSRFTRLLQDSLMNNGQMVETLLLEDAALLGSLTGNMHSALRVISPKYDLSFHLYSREVMLPGIQANLDDISQIYSKRMGLDEHVQMKIDHLIASGHEYLERFQAIADKFQDQSLMVVHGDYHLGQVLYHEISYYVIDFEGEPMRDASGSFILSLPYKDIAGMIRSFDYALAYSLKRSGKNVPLEFRISWLDEMMRQFLRSYMKRTDVPVDEGLLDLFLAEKAVYELKYELNNRLDWVDIPLTFLERL